MTFMEKVFGKGIIPLYYYLKGNMKFFYFHEYKKNLEMTKEEISTYQMDRLKKLIIHAYETVPYYKKLFDEAGIRPKDIKLQKDMKKIPVLTKFSLLGNQEDLKSTKRYKLKKYYSGGSTDIVWLESHKIFFKRMLGKFELKVNRQMMFNVFNYTDEDMEEWIKKDFVRFKPDYIFGFAGSIFEIARMIREKDIEIPQLKKIITTSERLENREYIEDVFNCKVLDQYGSTEAYAIAMEDENYVMHSSDDFVYVELDEDDEVLVTPLESYGMPLLRYKLGDIGFAKRKWRKNCTSPFQEFSIAIGRVYEVLLTKDNHKISGGLIKQKIEDENLEVGEFQVVQSTINSVLINVVADRNVTEEGVQESLT